MTIAQPMLFSDLRRFRAACTFALLMAAPFFGACASKQATRPAELNSPYDTSAEVVLAVAPLRNESGVSVVDELAVSDALVGEIEQTPGVSVLPMNRTLAAMRALRMPQVETPADALALAKAAGADGLIVGSITAWHPYDPPTLGLSLGIFGRSPYMRAPPDPTVDPTALKAARSEPETTDRHQVIGALSTVSQTFDAHNGSTRELVRAYAQGRHDPSSALTWRRYLASMGLYAKFACHEASRLLFDAERQRLRGPQTRQQASAAQ